MKIRLLILALAFSSALPGWTQSGLDVTSLVADHKTFVFNDNKHTVKEYIYAEMEAKTTCCGDDRIYMEVRIDPSGYVVEAKTLTGKNDCFKFSAIDIVKNIKWDTKDFKGIKSVYFEIKPDIKCEGEKNNTYAQVPVTNNQLLDTQGMQLNSNAGNSRPRPTSTASTPTETPAATNEPAQELVEAVTGTQPSPQASETPTPATTEPVQAEAATSTNAGNTASTTKAVETPSVETSAPATNPAKAANEIAEAVEQVVETPPAATPTSSTPKVEPYATTTDPVQNNELTEAIAEKQDPVKAEEIKILQEKMVEKKSAAEIRREKLEARRKRLAERRQHQQEEQAADDSWDGNSDRRGTSDWEDGEDQEKPRAQQEIEADQQQISDLQRQQAELESQMRQLEDNREQQARDLANFRRDMLRVMEEIRRKEEDIRRKQEQAELDRLEEDRRLIEENKRNLEDEMQRLVDEVQRLQNEMQNKMSDIDRQAADIERLANDKMALEQRVTQERSLREQQIESEIQLLRLQMEAANNNLISDASRGGVSFDGAPGGSSDTARIRLIQQQIQLLQEELYRIQNPTQAGAIAATGGVGTVRGGALLDPSLKSAATDRKWEDTNYGDPVSAQPNPYAPATPTYNPSPTPGAPTYNPAPGTPQQYVPNTPATAEQAAQAQQYDPNKYGFSPAANHQDSYANVPGPQFASVEYGSGDAAMKNYIRDRLSASNICGLAHAFVEITTDAGGNVRDSRVVKANTVELLTTLPGILNTMKFQETPNGLPQRSYFEFKADIVCGENERIDLKSVDPFLNTQ